MRVLVHACCSNPLPVTAVPPVPADAAGSAEDRHCTAGTLLTLAHTGPVQEHSAADWSAGFIEELAVGRESHQGCRPERNGGAVAEVVGRVRNAGREAKSDSAFEGNRLKHGRAVRHV